MSYQHYQNLIALVYCELNSRCNVVKPLCKTNDAQSLVNADLHTEAESHWEPSCLTSRMTKHTWNNSRRERRKKKIAFQSHGIEKNYYVSKLGG